MPTIWARRDKFFKDNASEDGLFQCAKTKQRIRRDEGHIDHLPPMTFEVIVTNFLASRGLSYEQVPLSLGDDNQTTAEITDPELVKWFVEFHDRVATLDFVKAEINLSQASRNRIKKSRMQKEATNG
jgi:hypothetical protein